MPTSRKRVTLLYRVLLIILLPMLVVLSAGAQTTDGYALYLPVINRDHNSFWTWLPKTSIELVPRPNSEPLLTIDHAGFVHLLWDTPVAPRFIYHALYDGSTWTNAEPITQTLGIAVTIHPPIVDD